ncbi:MAG: hypothetical protein HQ564_04490 [Candidatus Saganbacteria bacterium]|nr:hypothetical protein [Candidatus Saganbacteria bacterium]
MVSGISGMGSGNISRPRTSEGQRLRRYLNDTLPLLTRGGAPTLLAQVKGRIKTDLGSSVESVAEVFSSLIQKPLRRFETNGREFVVLAENQPLSEGLIIEQNQDLLSVNIFAGILSDEGQLAGLIEMLSVEDRAVGSFVIGEFLSFIGEAEIAKAKAEDEEMGGSQATGFVAPETKAALSKINIAFSKLPAGTKKDKFDSEITALKKGSAVASTVSQYKGSEEQLDAAAAFFAEHGDELGDLEEEGDEEDNEY